MPTARAPLFSAAIVALAPTLACGSDGSASQNGDASTNDGGIIGATDGATDGAISDGPSGSDGAQTNDAGTALCKRGIAANAAPSAAFAHTASSPGVAWWYDWSNASPPATPGIDFVPMIWGAATLNGPIPAGSHFVLGFNEPNFKSQSNLTPQQAATDWRSVEALARAQGAPIVSPAVNFCGSPANSTQCSDPAVTDPYTWLKDFFNACPTCKVDAIAVHWYNCDLPSLKAYIEGNGSLQGFVQFGKPIWLTEFSCDGSHSVADQKAYMQAAVPWLESNPHVARYAWFSAGPIPSALLANNGALTELGATYVALPQSCP
jgi:hypothetical protein